jgi:uncharacterized membrane protein
MPSAQGCPGIPWIAESGQGAEYSFVPFHSRQMKGISMSEPKSSVFSDNAAGAIAYITFLPAVAFLILVPYKKSPFVRFHAWQSVYLNFLLLVVSYPLDFVLSYCGKSELFYAVPTILLIALFWLLVWAFCAVKALNGKRFKLPILGALAERQANG